MSGTNLLITDHTTKPIEQYIKQFNEKKTLSLPSSVKSLLSIKFHNLVNLIPFLHNLDYVLCISALI